MGKGNNKLALGIHKRNNGGLITDKFYCKIIIYICSMNILIIMNEIDEFESLT